MAPFKLLNSIINKNTSLLPDNEKKLTFIKIISADFNTLERAREDKKEKQTLVEWYFIYIFYLCPAF